MSAPTFDEECANMRRVIATMPGVFASERADAAHQLERLIEAAPSTVVYVVIVLDSDVLDAVKGVFATREAAEAFVAEYHLTDDDHVVEEWRVGS